MTLTSRGKVMAVGAILILAFLIGLMAPWDSLPWNKVPVQYEDQQGWDCHTMGNRVCGK